jgi:3-oxoadipate enol-lactonase/4-carboxymuconolactone decarboxylase
MPFLTRDGARLYWRVDGLADAPALLLGNSLGTDNALWDPVLPRLIERHRVVRFDMRGHGASEAPRGDYTIEALARDALAVADAAGAGRFSYAGISIGGMIGQWLGAHAGERVERLVLSNTSSKLPAEIWNARIEAVRAGGLAAIVDAVLARWFTQGFLAKRSPWLESARSTLLATEPAGYLGCCAAIRDMDLAAVRESIRVPTLVVVGRHDLATPPEHGVAIAQSIAGAELAELPVAHIPVIERPSAFAALLLRFLSGATLGNDRERYAAGMARRMEVLGTKYMAARTKSVDPFNAEFQDLITRYAWGETWTREVLDDRTRRLIVLAMMLSLGRFEEFQMHVRSGLDAELSEDELKEVLLLSAIYAGVPVANGGFHKAAEVLAERAAQA